MVDLKKLSSNVVEVSPFNVLNDAKALRVAAYARVSTDKDDQANSFESQVKYYSYLLG